MEKRPLNGRGYSVCVYFHWAVLDFWAAVICPVCDVGVLWPNGWTDQDETWHAGRLRPWPQCVRWGPMSPPPKGHSPPIFWPMPIVPKWLDGSRCHLVLRPYCARWRPSSPPQKRGQSPQFFAHVYCGQMAAWISIPLGMSVGLYPGHIVLSSLSPKQGGTAPNFRPMFVVAKRLDG